MSNKLRNMEEKSFFYIDGNGVQQGPRTVKQLESEYVIGHNTMVWCQGMKDWCPASQVEELRGICDSRPPILETPVHREQPAPCSTMKEPAPHSWMVESILATLFCCVVFGIIGIVYASKVDSYWLAGRYEEARSAAKTAKLMFILGVSSAALFLLIYLGFFLVMGAAMTLPFL